MPELRSLVENRKSRFKKKNYRPWDLSGTDSSTPEDKIIETTPVTTDDQIKQKPATQSPISIPLETKHAEATADVLNSPPLETNPVTNGEQLDTQTDTKQITNREQLDNASIPIRKQIDTKQVTNGEQLDTQTGNKQITNREQLDNLLNPFSLALQIRSLSGLQQKLIDLVVNICLNNQKLETGPIQTRGVAEYIKTSIGSVKMCIKRLIDKKFLARGVGRTARGGFINLHIKKEVYETVLEQREANKFINNPLSKIKAASESTIDNNLDNKFPISSSNNITTTNTELSNQLPQEWLAINIHPLSEIGFTKTQLRQLCSENLNTPEIVQESINHFAFGLGHNKKIKTYSSPLNVLMGVLRKGLAWTEMNYQSPQEIAQTKLLESKKQEKERLKKLEEDAFNLALNDWEETLSKLDIQKILAESKVDKIMPERVKLSMYFRETVWAVKKSEYLV